MKKTFVSIILSGLVFLLRWYTHAATMYLSWWNSIRNCPTPIDIMIDSSDESFFWASAVLTYPWKDIEIVWFYLNTDFNLPMNVSFNEQDDGTGTLTTAALSMIRDQYTNKQIWFSWLVRYATLLIKNKEPWLSSSSLRFVFTTWWSTTDAMDVFRLWDATDILTSVSWLDLVFNEWFCPSFDIVWINQLDDTYDYQKHLSANLAAINQVEKLFPFKKFLRNALSYRSYRVIILLVITLFIIMYKKWYIHLDQLRFLHYNSKQNEQK